MNPRGLASAIYILLNSTKKYYKNGIRHLGSIEVLWENPNPKKLERKDECIYILDGVPCDEEECKYILDVMRKLGLSYRIDENEEFIPALCNSEIPRELYPSGYDAAKTIVEAVRNALLLYEPQTEEGFMGGMKFLPPSPNCTADLLW